MEASNSLHPDAIRILVATDNHLGYLERDPIRGSDSFKTFEEILTIAEKRQVDFILLGGDLFHDNKPSRKTLYKTMELIRRYCWGDRACHLSIQSDQSVHFPDRFSIVNFEDPNINVSMPIFSIHGNHDDPSGDGNLCVLDLLRVAGMVNYFGKAHELDDIKVTPILIQKGTNKLALFGLGNVRDDRLSRTIAKQSLCLRRPKDNPDDWFNLFVLHQNRYPHGSKNYIPERCLQDFIHLIIWGHEHECIPTIMQNEEKDFHIWQPGSSIATSLCDGEAQEKSVGILEIKNHNFHVEFIRLLTVRPFVIDSLVLAEEKDVCPSSETGVRKVLEKKVRNMIEQAKEKWRGAPTVEAFPLPLIRLKVNKVDYSGGFGTFNSQRFGQLFVNEVANPGDILLFGRRKAFVNIKGCTQDIVPNFPEKVAALRMETLIEEFIRVQKMDLLPDEAFGEAVTSMVEKDDREAIQTFVSNSLRIFRRKFLQTPSVEGEQLLSSRILSERLCLEMTGGCNEVSENKLHSNSDLVANSHVDGSTSLDEKRKRKMPDNDRNNCSSNVKKTVGKWPSRRAK